MVEKSLDMTPIILIGGLAGGIWYLNKKGVFSSIGSGINNIVEGVKSAGEGAYNVIINAGQNVYDAGKGVVETAQDAVEYAPPAATKAITDIATGKIESYRYISTPDDSDNDKFGPGILHMELFPGAGQSLQTIGEGIYNVFRGKPWELPKSSSSKKEESQEEK